MVSVAFVFRASGFSLSSTRRGLQGNVSPRPVVKILVQGKLFSNYFFFKRVHSFQTLAEVKKQLQITSNTDRLSCKRFTASGTEAKFQRCLCLLCHWQSLGGKVLSGTFYGFSNHKIPGQTTPISLLLGDPNYKISVIKQSYYNDFKISFLAYQVPGLAFSLTITEAVS